MKTVDYSKMTETQAIAAAYQERCESHRRYDQFCRAIKTNATRYKSKTACELMRRRVIALWVKRGSYGVEKTDMEQAVAALQDRWIELHGMEMDARWAN